MFLLGVLRSGEPFTQTYYKKPFNLTEGKSLPKSELPKKSCKIKKHKMFQIMKELYQLVNCI